jgi:predicted SAM-dependent methyltransferase
LQRNIRNKSIDDATAQMTFSFIISSGSHFILLYIAVQYAADFNTAMYLFIKRLVVRLLPERFIRRIEFYLRFLYSLFYLGSAVRCNLCEGRFSRFIFLESGDLLCPRCGSLPRHRRLWEILQSFFPEMDGMKILHFSPSRMLQKKLLSNRHLQYVTTDYDTKAHTDKHYDITRIPEPDENYSLIICFHVLEHISDDRQAIRELYRVTEPGGRVFIQTPFQEGDIYEDVTRTTPDERRRDFGQEDHVRIYSIEGLVNRLHEAGFAVQVERYEQDPQMGLKEETVLVCRKTK